MNYKLFSLFLFISFFFYSSFCKIAAKSDSLIFEVKEESLKSFYKELKIICKKNNLQKFTTHRSYPKFGKKIEWQSICIKIKNNGQNEKRFILNNFQTINLSNKEGLLTGYYEPEINVSKKKSKRFTIPILKYNANYKKMTREDINKNFNNKDVLLWTDNKIDLFFLQIQGSGIGLFENKKKIKISYAGNNDLKYKSIGKLMLKKRLIKGELNLFSIKDYLNKNLKKVDQILNYNERYIFFKLSKKNILDSSKGAMGLNLSPFVSVAIDTKHYPLGLPLVLQSKIYGMLPVIAMDKGSAIIGKNRADLFIGRGKKAEKIAGKLKEKLVIHALIPRNKK